MSATSRKYMSKRQRPCDFCRSRKTACRIEGQLPCRLCSLHGRQCTFLEAAQPRKRPTPPASNEGATSRPEASHLNDAGHIILASFGEHVAMAATASPGNNDTDFLATRASPRQATLLHDASNQDLMLEDLTEQFFGRFEDAVIDFQSGNFQSGWTPMEDGPSPEIREGGTDVPTSPDCNSTEAHLDTNNDLNPQILGYSGDMDPYLLQSYQYNTSDTFKFKQLSIRSVRQGSTPIQFLLSQPGLFSQSRHEMGLHQTSSDVSRRELESVVPVDTGQRLISLCRKFILPHYPIFSDELFPNPQTSSPSLLATIYMIAQPFAKFDDVLSVELAYERLNSETLFKLIAEALQYEAHNPSLALVQTLLLLVVRPSTNPLILESSLKWSLHGTLVATAHTLGLHHDPTSWAIASWQRALRRRLSFTIFAVDKWLACSLGRPPLITQDDWLVTTPANADSHTSSLSSDVWLAHIHYAALGRLLGDVIMKLFSLRAVNELSSDLPTSLDISKGLLDRLSKWHNALPAHSDNHTTAVKSLLTLSTLGYHYVQMMIFRAIIRPILGANASSIETANALLENLDDVERFARKGVRSATAGATTFVNSLQQEHFPMFWPQWSQVAFSCICFLDLLMATSSSDTEEAVSWFKDLYAARREMRLKSNMLPVLRLGLLRIDAIFWKGVDKVLHLQPHVQQALEASLDDGSG